MKIIKIQGVKDSYPEVIEGTNEWYSCMESKSSFCDLYEAEEIIKSGNKFPGVTEHLIHYPEGRVYTPFKLQENIYVEKPVYADNCFYFQVVDFTRSMVEIFQYKPITNALHLMAEINLTEIKDCYNLRLEVSPVMLGRSGNEGYYEIIWPERKIIPLSNTETVCFRDGNLLYSSEWIEDPEYHEFVIIRAIDTGEIIEKRNGSICRLANDIVWEI